MLRVRSVLEGDFDFRSSVSERCGDGDTLARLKVRYEVGGFFVRRVAPGYWGGRLEVIK